MAHSSIKPFLPTASSVTAGLMCEALKGLYSTLHLPANEAYPYVRASGDETLSDAFSLCVSNVVRRGNYEHFFRLLVQ